MITTFAVPSKLTAPTTSPANEISLGVLSFVDLSERPIKLAASISDNAYDGSVSSMKAPIDNEESYSSKILNLASEAS